MRRGVTKREVLCPDCGERREVYADREVMRCRGCEGKRRRKGKVVACPGCGAEHYVSPTYLSRGVKYCSYACANEHVARGPLSAEQRRKLSAGKTGERNPNWKHGKRADQASRAFSLSAKGDEVACRNCGAVGKLHLHHIIPRSMYRAGRDEIRNGVPLCPSCHIGWHRRTVTLCRDIFTGEEWSYVSSAELLGQSVTAWLDDRYPLRRITNERQAA